MADKSQNVVDAMEGLNEIQSNISQLRRKLDLMLSEDNMILDDSTSFSLSIADSTNNYSIMQRDIHKRLTSTPNKKNGEMECKSQMDGLSGNGFNKKENDEFLFKKPYEVSRHAPFKCEKCGESLKKHGRSFKDSTFGSKALYLFNL